MSKKNTLHRAPIAQGPSGSDWIAILGMDGRLLLARSGRVHVQFTIITNQAIEVGAWMSFRGSSHPNTAEMHRQANLFRRAPSPAPRPAHPGVDYTT